MRFFFIILTFLFYLGADDRAIYVKKYKNEQRVALIIGNNNYMTLAKLKNPINDARAIRDILEGKGFDVIYGEDVKQVEFQKLLKKFSSKLRYGGVGFFYFAGHGLQIKGSNYLVASNSNVSDRDAVEFETIPLDYVVKKMKSAGNRLNVVVLDACRNDPFTRSGGGGLAPIQDASGLFVAYATEAGKVAQDGSGENGVFTESLIKYIKEPWPIEKVFKKTREEVYNKTDGDQSPGVYNQIRGDFYFTVPTATALVSSEKSAYQVKNVVERYSLYVKRTPSDAKVEITDSALLYFDGVLLKKGKYKVRISKNGYYTKMVDVDLKNDFHMSVDLDKKPVKSIFKDIWKDEETGLIWQKTAITKEDKKNYDKDKSGGRVWSWSEAREYCANLTLEGKSDWRLPSRDELKSLLLAKAKKNRHDDLFYIKEPLSDTLPKQEGRVKGATFWTSTSKSGEDAWNVSFFTGSSYWDYKSYKGYVMCVRR